MEKISMLFEVSAGKYEEDGNLNTKYVGTFDGAQAAVDQFEWVNDYPWAELTLILEVDGHKRRINLLGGDDPELRLRMDIGLIWMEATGRQFVDVAMPAEDQVREIRESMKERTKLYDALYLRNQANAQARMKLEDKLGALQHAYERLEAREQQLYERHKQVSSELVNAQYELSQRTSWQIYHAQFEAGQLTWTQAFEALMSKCGMSMEQALECLANHFDRRPVITVQEVR